MSGKGKVRGKEGGKGGKEGGKDGEVLTGRDRVRGKEERQEASLRAEERAREQ